MYFMSCKSKLNSTNLYEQKCNNKYYNIPDRERCLYIEQIQQNKFDVQTGKDYVILIIILDLQLVSTVVHMTGNY